MSLQAIHRSRAARRWIGALALLAFGLKALVPTGFMLAAVEGQVRLVMCPAGMHHPPGMPTMAEMIHGPGAEHAATVDHAAHAALASQQCPFALASGAALLAQAPSPAEPYFLWLPPARAGAVASVPAAPPLRHHAPRGPPALA